MGILILCASCRQPGAEPPVFRRLSPSQTGIAFANTIKTSDSLNALTVPYIYNGAGVAVGDIDNDGLPDIFFAGNQVTSRLYLNKGNMRFEDITKSAGVETHGWATGVTMVDINNDGYLDIYVSMSGPTWSRPEERRNLLFINNGNRTFTESAAKYHIDDPGFTTDAVFLDYNGDGCLDLFLLNNSPKDFSRASVSEHPAGIIPATPDSYNQLYRNNCDSTFTNVSEQAGILKKVGYGLGVAVADINGDGRPDIYVSNDIQPNDVLYVNNGDGTFTDQSARLLKHTSFAGMGVDIADFNNDGLPDILQADMIPPDLRAQKRMSGFQNPETIQELKNQGYRIDYDINSLQLNNGGAFSEIARMAGVAYTDWSWSALFADFDNDGRKDIFVSSGYPKAVNDFDYDMAVYRANRRGDTATEMKELRELRSYEVPSFVFRNNGDLTFTDKSKAWGITQPGFAYGAAYADLNNDGKLDLVVNNMDAPASIYENIQPAGSSHYLAIALQGDPPNRDGIGAKLRLKSGEQTQYLYHSPYRGYMSSMDPREHFGLGTATRADTLEVDWPDGRSQILTDLPVDRLLVIKQRDATRPRPSRPRPTSDPQYRFFHEDPSRAPHYKQVVSSNDYAVQPLLPYEPSRQGPAVAVGDVNGDGLDDVFIGGQGGTPGKLFLQQQDGTFRESPIGQPWASEPQYEDWGARFFDANGDGKLDLYVASGGYQLAPISPLLQDRLYINQGNGRFVRDTAALPPMLASKAAIAVGDFNGDGKPDLFVGGRLMPRNYPYPARSYILRNDGGHFTDVTEQLAPELAKPFGMITAALWVDFDGDGRLDLVVAGEWMGIQFFRNDGKQLRNVTASMGLPPSRGWWYSLAAGDFNHDGRIDLVAGNLGLNYSYTTSDTSKFGVYAADFTGGGNTNVVLTKELGGHEFPMGSLAALGRAIYTIGIHFPTYTAFSNASIAQMFSPTQLQRALHYQTDTFASLYLQNNGNGTFTATPLPTAAQVSPIRGIIVRDVDGDGNLDLIVAGNLYDTEWNTPRADASNGLWLRGDGKGHFTPVPPVESGFFAPLNVTGLSLVKTPAGTTVLVANSGDFLSAFTIRR